MNHSMFVTASHPVFWNDIARQLCAVRSLGLSQAARLFALLKPFMDTYIGVWHAKFDVYFNWRPITAIQLYYQRLKTIVDDVVDARVDAGIHFRFDNTAGVVQGRNTAKYVFKRAFRYDGVDGAEDGPE